MEIGTKLGHYEIIDRLGAGGMGEIYRARDTKLKREVALKLLPEDLATNPERLARLERKAQMLAAINHPNIAAIYSLEESGDARFLVLELVEGQTLEQQLANSPFAIEKALELGRQIAGALGAAHDEGIVHRDLKPANIMLTHDGRVKVLDFGIDKAISTDDRVAETVQATELTLTGTLIGTAPYMSPEQVRGDRVDKRVDNWAFGCLMFEAFTGRRAFDRKTVADTLAAIIEVEPPWNLLPAAVPGAVQRLLRRCLQKDPDHRLHDISDARIEIDETLASPQVRAAAAPRVVAWWAAGVLAILVVGTLVFQRLARELPVPSLVNPSQVTAAIGVEDYPAWSPDGRRIAYEANQSGNWDIWIGQSGGGQSVNRTEAHHGTDRYPSWSPDGRQIAFWSERDGGGYFIMPALGGSIARLAATPATDDGYHGPPAWSTADDELAYIVYEPAGAAFKASLEIISLVTRDTRQLPLVGSQECRLDPSWSPDGRFLAYLDTSRQFAETTQLFVVRLSDGEAVPITEDRANVRSPFWSPDGRALYYVANRVGTTDIWRQPLNDDGRPDGEPQQITAGLEVRHASLSPDGKRVSYSRGRWVANVWRVPILAGRPATWADAEQITFEEAFIEFVDVSPDGRHLAFSSARAGNQDLWRMPMGGGEPVNLTIDSAPEWAPRWSPDGRELAFYSYRTGDREIWVMPADGDPARQLTSSPGMDAVPEWSPDGRQILFRSERRGNSDIYVMAPDGTDVRLLTPSPYPDGGATWSPDGRWVAFASSRDGNRRIWRVPEVGGEAEPVTDGGVGAPHWSADGARIFFPREGNFWSVVLETGDERPVTDLIGRRGTLNTQPASVHEERIYFTWRDDVGDIWLMDIAEE